MTTLKETITAVIDQGDAEMAKRLAATMKPGDLKHRVNESFTLSLAVIRQLGFSRTALVIEEYLTKGKIQ
jgi:hypothetical protein